MCGIFGAININNFFQEQDYEQFVSLTDIVTHRGPDASGYLPLCCKESRVGNPEKFDVFLGHRRLSIIDLSDNANQPMCKDQKIWISFNGEIYNYLELRKDLKKQGCIFTTNSDTEVILSVYDNWGTKGFASLNGMWAFAIVDLARKQVVLSRDRFSIKPLYYYQRRGILFFSSEIKQLLPLLESKKVNRSTMFRYLNQGILESNEETFFEDIYKLKPKHNLIISLSDGSIREEQYWDYEIKKQEYTFEQAKEEFRSLLTDSIRLRLRSDVKVGALLSGGLDSSAISVLANTIQEGGFETFSVVSKNENYSEAKFINALVKETGIVNHKLIIDDNSSLLSINDTLYYNDEPPGSFSTVAHFKMMEKIKKETGITVVLSGQGGDEILLGYRKYFFFYIKQLLKHHNISSLLSEIASSLFNRTVLWQFDLGEASRYLPWKRKSSHEYLLGTSVVEPIFESSDLRFRQIVDIEKYSVPSLTHYEDRSSMASSLEIRLPFLDYRLVNFALNLPPDFKMHRGWSKYILRESIYELPKCIRWRRDKQGFLLPEKLWLKSNLSSLIHDIFQQSILAEMGVIDSKCFLRHYEKFLAGKSRIWYTDITRVLFAELWARKYLSESTLEPFIELKISQT